ncbi:MAG: hypothetical protein A49_01640 [Methyloceanibacter sp.]|nr:MAG: hypothetical protein A49_01640 [Methyloceanibacter sp.]
MTSAESTFRKEYETLQAEYAALVGASGFADQYKPPSQAARFIANAYALLWVHTHKDCPYLYSAQRLLESDVPVHRRADQIAGVIQGFKGTVDVEGYIGGHDTGPHWSSYELFAASVRNWLIAYGVGGPVVLMSQDLVAAKLLASGQVRSVGALFLLGVFLQVVKAIVYRTTSWYGVDDASTTDADRSWQMRASDWINCAVWLEVLVDIATIGLFSFATFSALSSLG